MRKFRKLFLVLVMVVLALTLTACSGSQINNVQEDFNEAEYKMYEYKNYIAANFDLEKIIQFNDPEATVDDQEQVDRVSQNAMFIPVDYMSLELRAYILNQHDIDDDNALNYVTIEEYATLDVIDDLTYNVYVFAYYDDTVEPQINKTAVVIEFESEEYLQEVLDVSTVIQSRLDGRDIEDHINGSLLLLVRTDDFYDEIVEIFNQSETE